MNKNMKMLMLTALFAALTAVLAQIAIPIAMIPITMTHVAIFLGASLIGPYWGMLSQVVYLLLGACGVPVYANFTGGLGHLTGVTGGYLVGYALCALVAGLIAKKTKYTYWGMAIGFTAGCVILYVFGSIWFMITMEKSLAYTMASCVFPYIPGDIVKIIISMFLVKRLQPYMKNI